MKKIIYASTLLLFAGQAAFAQTGNVGIGTSTPQTKLHVLSTGTGGATVIPTNTTNIIQRLENNQNGQAAIQHFLTKDAAGAARQFVLGINPLYNGGGTFYMGADGGNERAIHMDLASGNISMGSSSPQSKLHVVTQGIGGASVTATNIANMALTLENGSLGDTQFGNSVIQRFVTKDLNAAVKQIIMGVNPTYNGGNGTFYIGTDGSNNQHISLDMVNGGVGIGTSIPISAFGETAKLSVVTPAGVGQYIQSSSADLNGLLTLEKTTATTVNDQFIFFNSAGTNIGSVIANGPAGVNYNTTSDARLKENIRVSRFGIDDVMKIQVRDYNYKKDKKSQQTGFIAQQLYTVFPNAVTKGGEDAVAKPWMVDYSKVTPLLTKAIQDQQAEIEALRAEVNALKTQNGGLRAEVSKVSELSDELHSLKASIEKLAGNTNSGTGKSLAK